MRSTVWQDRTDEIDERRKLALLQGGEDAVRKQHDKGRLTVRERIERILDKDTLKEGGPIAGEGERAEDGSLSFTPANFVLGIGKIAGRSAWWPARISPWAPVRPTQRGCAKAALTPIA